MTAASVRTLLLLFVLTLPGTGRAGAQRERGSLPRGASIAVENHASDLLVSADGAFACGFYAVSPTVFTFSVWFARSADRAVVWTAAASATARRAVHSQGSRLVLDGRRGALLLTDYDGEVVWNSTAHDGAARARLRDTGNLAVEDARGAVLWQSFDHPTDTLLPASSWQWGLPRRVLGSHPRPRDSHPMPVPSPIPACGDKKFPIPIPVRFFIPMGKPIHAVNNNLH